MLISSEWLIITLLGFGLFLVWYFDRQYRQSNSTKVVDASINLMEQLRAEVSRKDAIIAMRERAIRVWRRYAFTLRDQIWRLGHDPDVDEPTNNDAVSTSFDKRFADALIDSFDLSGLDLLLLSVNQRREDITTANGKTAIIYDVIERAQREHWISALKSAAQLANPDNELLQRAAK